MAEDFVPYKLAVKLKEKGYPQRCCGKYVMIGACYFEDGRLYEDGCIAPVEDCFTAPRIDQVLKWLREEKHLFVDISLCAGGYYGYIYSTIIQKDKDFSDGWMFDGKYDTYELAALAGIEYTLNNLI